MSSSSAWYLPLGAVTRLLTAVVLIATESSSHAGVVLKFTTSRGTLTLEFPTGVPDGADILADGDRILLKRLDASGAELVITAGDKTVAVDDGGKITTHARVAVQRRGAAVVIASLAPPIGTAVGIGKTLDDGTEPGPIISLPGHTSTVYTIAFSKDNTRAVSSSFTPTSGNSSEMILWDLEKRKSIHNWPGNHPYSRFVAKGQALLSVVGGTVELWDLRTFRKTGAIEVQANSRCNAISADGKLLATGDELGNVIIWDFLQGRKLQTLKQSSEITAVAFSPDGRRVLFGDQTGMMRLWDLDKDRMERQFDGHKSAPHCVTFTPDGKHAMSAAGATHPRADHTIRVWEVATGKELKAIKVSVPGKCDLLSTTFSATGHRAVCGMSDGSVAVWDLDGETSVAAFTKHKGGVSAVSVSDDGRYALSGSTDGVLWLYRMPKTATAQADFKKPGKE